MIEKDSENIDTKVSIKIEEATCEELKKDILIKYKNILGIFEHIIWKTEEIRKLERWFLNNSWEEIAIRDYFDKTHSNVLDEEWDHEWQLWIIKITFKNWKTMFLSIENPAYRTKIKWIHFLDTCIMWLPKSISKNTLKKIHELKSIEIAFFNKKKKKAQEKINNNTRHSLIENILKI